MCFVTLSTPGTPHSPGPPTSFQGPPHVCVLHMFAVCGHFLHASCGVVTCLGSLPSALLLKPSALFCALSHVSSRHGKFAGHRSCPVCCPLGTVGRQRQAKPSWRACRTDHAHWSAHVSRAAHGPGDMPRGACPSLQRRGPVPMCSLPSLPPPC